MKTCVIEVHDMLTILNVLDVERRIGKVPGVESVTANYGALRRNPTRSRRDQKRATTLRTVGRRAGFIGRNGMNSMNDPMHTPSEAAGRDGRFIGVS